MKGFYRNVNKKRTIINNMNWKPTTLKLIVSLVISIVIIWPILVIAMIVGLYFRINLWLFSINSTLNRLVILFIINFIVIYIIYSLIQKNKIIS